MAYKYIIDNIIISKDKDKDLYAIRDSTATTEVIGDFYGDIFLWLSYEEIPPVQFYYGESHKDFFPSTITITGSQSTDAAKIGTYGFLLDDCYIQMEWNYHTRFPISYIGRYGTWFNVADNDINAYIMRFSSDTHSYENSLGYNSLYNKLFIRISDDYYDTDWSPTEGEWYFIEYAYDLPNSSIKLIVDGIEVYSETLPSPIEYVICQDFYIIDEGETSGYIYLDNTMLSTKPTRDLYSLRNLESCPKNG